MSAPCSAADLHRHADALDHAAALGGYVDDRDGQRHPIGVAERARWLADAAILREHAYRLESPPVGG